VTVFLILLIRYIYATRKRHRLNKRNNGGETYMTVGEDIELARNKE